MKYYLVTGGAGFFGRILVKRLLALGHACVSIDIQPHDYQDNNLIAIQGDIRYQTTYEGISQEFSGVFHCAALLSHATQNKQEMWSTNVTGTQIICNYANEKKIPHLVFISSNCLWAKNFHRPVLETDIPEPIEVYGASKWQAEKILLDVNNYFTVSILRTPTIIDAGRLGLLSILFEFIHEGRRVWMVGAGNNKYQFIYSHDLVDACLLSLNCTQSEIFNIGSDNVKSLREVYQYIIDHAGTQAHISHFPKTLTISAMKLFYALGMSPLGPYQYRMIAEDFIFNTEKLKSRLAWKPTLTNEEMLWRAYDYYQKYRQEIQKWQNVSAHRKSASMGIIRLLKWIS